MHRKTKQRWSENSKSELKRKENQDYNINECNCKTKGLTDKRITAIIDKEHPTNIEDQLHCYPVQHLSYYIQ